jgi:hypothetical protein
VPVLYCDGWNETIRQPEVRFLNIAGAWPDKAGFAKPAGAVAILGNERGEPKMLDTLKTWIELKTHRRAATMLE